MKQLPDFFKELVTEHWKKMLMVSVIVPLLVLTTLFWQKTSAAVTSQIIYALTPPDLTELEQNEIEPRYRQFCERLTQNDFPSTYKFMSSEFRAKHPFASY